MDKINHIYDTIIIGGGPAGLSAALLLGRGRRDVLVCDGGSFRNASAPISHSFFTRDGVPPMELLRLGREQLQAYPTVRYTRSEVLEVVQRGQQAAAFFEVCLCPKGSDCRDGDSRGEWVRARKLLLATGMRDELPSWPGLHNCWGKSAFACPYCHGYEVRNEPLALLGQGEVALEMATLLTGWSRDLVICSNGPLGIIGEKRDWLQRHGIQVREDPIARLAHQDGHLHAVVFGNGDTLPRSAAVLRPRPVLRAASLVAALGCRLTSQGFIEVDAVGRTSIPGVHAAGDTSSPMPSISNAVQAGTLAAGALNAALISENLEREELAVAHLK